MKFSKEEIEKIDKKLEEAQERQFKNGNKRYSLDEAWEYINNNLKEIQYL